MSRKGSNRIQRQTRGKYNKSGGRDRSREKGRRQNLGKERRKRQTKEEQG